MSKVLLWPNMPAENRAVAITAILLYWDTDKPTAEERKQTPQTQCSHFFFFHKAMHFLFNIQCTCIKCKKAYNDNKSKQRIFFTNWPLSTKLRLHVPVYVLGDNEWWCYNVIFTDWQACLECAETRSTDTSEISAVLESLSSS